MRKIKLNWFELGTLFWVLGSLFVLLFSLMGVFNTYSIILGFALATIMPIQMYRQKELEIERIKSLNFKILVLTVFTVGMLSSIFTTPTIFGGRDEGSYSNAAITLAENGKRNTDSELIENFYDIYGTSKALNFPGFQYDSQGNLESQFLPGYSNWLAIFYKLFGLNGLKFAHLLPFMTFVLSFYLLVIEVFPLIKKEPTNPKGCLDGNVIRKCWLKLTQAEQFGWIGVIFLISFMPLLLFYKFTLSEIYYASLAWFSAYLLIRYFKDRRFLRFKTLFIPLILMIFIRIETVAIIFTLLLIMIGKDYNHLKQARYQFFFALSGVMLLVLVWLEPNFFINAFKGVSEISGLNANAMPESRESTILGKMIPDDWKNLYAFKIWFNYNLLPFVIMSGAFLFAIFKSIFKTKKIGNEKALIITPFLLFLPIGIYLVDANISLDHPWMLRRWLFAIIPLMFFYSVFFLFHLRQKNRALYRLVTAFVILGNLALFTTPSKEVRGEWNNLFTFSQNETLLEQTYELSELFDKNDLVLMSQKSSGSGWSLMAEPMRNLLKLQTVYFFNAKDYAELDHEDFDNIFLVTTPEEEFLYENISKEKIAEKVIKNSLVDPSRDPLKKPQIVQSDTKINIYKIID